MSVSVDIYRRGVRKHTAYFTENSSLAEEISASDMLSFEFKSEKFLHIERGDYIVVGDKSFIFTQEPNVEKISNGEYKFTGKMYDESAYMDDILFLFVDEDGSQSVIYSNSSEFDLTANIDEFIALLVRNINRVVTSRWTYTISPDIDLSDMRNLTFSNQSCKDALTAICEEFELEWMFDNGVLRISKEFSRQTSIVLSYPANLLSTIKLTKEDSDETCTRLFVFGSERNIPENYGSSRLKMIGGDDYISRNRLTYIKERVKIFDEVYPRRNGHVTGVSRTPSGIQFVIDSTLEFDIREHLSDNTAKIAFTSGKLVGYEFEIASYNHAGRVIEIKQQTEGDIIIPNETMCPEVGDKYVLLDILMPDSYVRNAETELREKALEYFRDKCDDKVTVNVEVSTKWVISNNITLKPSMFVNIHDDDIELNRKIRITKVVAYPFDDGKHQRRVEVTLSDFLRGSKISKMSSKLDRTERVMYSNFRGQRNQNNTSSLEIEMNADSLTWASGTDFNG